MGIPLPHSLGTHKISDFGYLASTKVVAADRLRLVGICFANKFEGSFYLWAEEKKCEQIKRTNNVMVRFTDAEYASISISAEQAGYPVAVYVRKSALDEHIEVHYNITAELPELQKLIAEYSAIGNNLNQIAQFFHSGGFHSKSMQDEINRHLTALWQLRQEQSTRGNLSWPC